MYTIVIQTNGHCSNRVECSLARDRKAVIEFLLLLEDSARVKAYKVVDSDSGIVKDLYASFGLGQMNKFTSSNFIWN